MPTTTELYRAHKGIIHQQVLHHARRYPGTNRDDLLWEANGIFLKAVESWEPARAKFTTHLFHQLRALSGPIRREIRISQGVVHVDRLESHPVGSRRYLPLPPPEHVEPPEVEDLTDDARRLLSGLLSGEFSRKGGKHPCKRTAYSVLAQEGWSHARLRETWDHLGQWVLEGGTPW